MGLRFFIRRLPQFIGFFLCLLGLATYADEPRQIGSRRELFVDHFLCGPEGID